MNKTLAIVLLAAASTLAHAQTKKELVDKVLQLQRPIVEAQARQLAERPAGAIMQSVSVAVQQRVPLEKREAVLKDIQGDVRQLIEQTAPLLRDHALRLLPQTSGAVLESKFTEAELKQLLAALEAPAFRKYQQSTEEMFRPLAEKLAAEARTDMEQRLQGLEQTIRKKLEAAAAPPAAKP